MDQTTFLNELLTVKDRVNEMASTFNRSPRSDFSRTTPTDMFSNHLEDVKARLHSMQDSLNLLSVGSGQQGSPLGASPHWVSRPNDFPSLPSAPSALPSGPLFWQLFDSVRADVRGLTDRLVGVERDVSDLEDRLDDLRPNRFTPPESEDTPSSIPPQRDYPPLSSWNAPKVDAHHHFTDFQGQPYLQESHGASVQSWATPELSTEGRAECPAPEGVAFRDREIVALEDRVRELQESLRYNEDLTLQLRSERQCESSKVAVLCQRLRDCTELNARSEVELDKSRELATELTRKHEFAMQELSSRLQHRSQQWLAAQQQIHRLQSSVYDVKNKTQDDLDDMLAEKDDALHRIREMAVKNSAIISQQQEIISRGAAIMQEKDDEIDRLSQELDNSQVAESNEQQERDRCAKMLIEHLTRELSKTQENYRNEQQERERCSAQLKEKSDEALELRQALTKALMPQLPRGGRSSESEDGSKAQAPDRPIVSPFATPLGRRARSMQWSPQALPLSSRLPQEVRRANVWNTGKARDDLRFGVPGQINLPLREDSTDEDSRRNDSRRLPVRLFIEEDEQRSTTPVLNYARSHRGLHVNNYAKYHGLPARQTSSMADMQSRKGDRLHQHETGPEQQHAQTAPRSRLQAYVEAEESSGGERRGGAA